jgi:hypothetical protein
MGWDNNITLTIEKQLLGAYHGCGEAILIPSHGRDIRKNKKAVAS